MLTDEQRALRRTGITATDAAAILDLSPFRSPLDVYREKKGELDDLPAMLELEGGELRETKDTERGRYLEKALVEWTGARLQRPAYPNAETLRCAWDPLILATPDGFLPAPTKLITDLYPLEVKAPGTFWRSDEWGPDGADAEGNVPAGYEVQLRIQMAVSSADEGYLGALIGPELRVYRLRRDVELERKLIAKLHEWHERHVVADVPPAVSLSERDQKWFKNRYPNDKLPPMREVDLTAAQRTRVRELLSAYMEREVWSALYDGLQVELKEILGDHGGLLLEDGGRIDWKSNKPGSETDWEAMARDLHRRLALGVELARHIPHDRVPPELVDVVCEPDDLCRPWDAEVAPFTKITPGNRVFRPWPKKTKS